MNFGELLRYRGVLIAAAVLLVVVFVSAFATKGLQENSLQSELALQKIDSLSKSYKSSGALPNSGEFADWDEGFSSSQRDWLEKTSGNQLSSVRDAVVAADQSRFNSALNSLRNNASAEASKRARLLTMAPLAICLLGVLIYFLAIIPQLLRLSAVAEVQVESNQQAENILNTVSEGLFLLDKNGDIGVEQSKSLKGMFRMKRDLEGSFLEFIGGYVPDSAVAVAKDYLDLLYGDRVKEKLVKDLNPLNKVEVSITRRDGSIENRYLDFNFARVMVDGELQHLLGSVTDVTREVRLEQELENNKQEQEAQLDLLMNILHLDKRSLSRFYSETEASLDSINETLQERGHSSDQIRNKLITISEQAHKIKGDAAALKLHNFEFIMHEFETELAIVQQTKGSISGREVLPAVTKLKDVFKELNNMQSIVTRFSEVLKMERGQGAVSGLAAVDVTVTEKTDDFEEAMSSVESSDTQDSESVATAVNDDDSGLVDDASKDATEEPADEQLAAEEQSEEASEEVTEDPIENDGSQLESELQDLVEMVAERNDVQVKLRTVGLDSVPEDLSKVIRDSSIQILRNCVAHGARPAAERVANGKAEFMTINMAVQATDAGHNLVIRDDGEGLDREKIIEKAIDKGMIKAESADKVTPQVLAKLIFHPGFSTRDKADLDAGRGVGLSAVYSMIREAGGALGFSHEPGQFTQFSVRFKG